MAEFGVARPGPASHLGRAFQRGTNQSGMRNLNERLVLSLVRQRGSLSKAEISQMTELSAQTVSVIVRALENDGLLMRNEPVRGRVGQPSVPMSLDPDGAFFLGLKVGRRSAQLVLLDFVGTVRMMRHLAYPYPVPDDTIRFALAAIEEARASLPENQRHRVAGVGIAMPFRLWEWSDAPQVTADARARLDEWRDRDIRAEIEDAVNLPTYMQNDATAACGAELVFGDAPLARDFVYLYIGTFPGGGVVINGSLYPGPTGNAGALGSMPVPGPNGTVQLIEVAAVAKLEQALVAGGRDPSHLWTSPDDWGDIGPELDAWIESAASGLAYAIVAASAVIDFQLAIVDGWMPADIRRRLVEATASAITRFDLEGVTVPAIRAGTVGIHARALGAASLPLADRFLYSPVLPGSFDIETGVEP